MNPGVCHRASSIHPIEVVCGWQVNLMLFYSCFVLGEVFLRDCIQMVAAAYMLDHEGGNETVWFMKDFHDLHHDLVTTLSCPYCVALSNRAAVWHNENVLMPFGFLTAVFFSWGLKLSFEGENIKIIICRDLYFSEKQFVSEVQWILG